MDLSDRSVVAKWKKKVRCEKWIGCEQSLHLGGVIDHANQTIVINAIHAMMVQCLHVKVKNQCLLHVMSNYCMSNICVQFMLLCGQIIYVAYGCWETDQSRG